jgi:hypothetical protein
MFISGNYGKIKTESESFKPLKTMKVIQIPSRLLTLKARSSERSKVLPKF